MAPARSAVRDTSPNRLTTVEPDINVPGYTVAAEIYRGGTSAVLRGTRDSDGLPVIIKALREEHPAPLQTAGLRREYELLRQLRIRGVPQAYSLEAHRDRLALVLEDVGGSTLKTLIARGEIDLPRFFDLAHQLAVVIGELHRRNIIHKDVNSNNVIVNLETGRASLTDFGIASRLTNGQPAYLQHPHLLEGTIAYMSPEQTGRMNRDLDYRSDLYSLGVTYYEMLTGRLPFESVDPLEVIHGHVANTPVAPHLIEPAVPPSLSGLVMKLLAKSAEDRYQSAEGVSGDLVRCRAALESGDVTELALGQDDLRERFVIPRRLYGRGAEIGRLLEAFDRVAAGSVELVLVSGYSGIGKTSLVQEIYRSLAQRRGHFIAGKSDPLARDVPYAALVQAFQGMVRHLLGGSDDEVAAWRVRVLDAVGGNAQVIADGIPGLTRLIGPQPPAPALDSPEAQNRFNRVFQQFVGAFARPEHPLVLFLDDLQWADAATLALLPRFITNSELSGLLVIGAYRDNEVTPTHPLTGAIANLKTRGAPLTELALPPLGLTHLHALLSDALGAAPGVTDLGAVLFDKTGGNPFFAIQLLTMLHRAGHLTFDREARQWQVDLDAIRRLRITKNVGDLMAEQIQRLDQPARRALRLAACVGHRFDLATLATIGEGDPAGFARDLWPALEQGLVLSEEQSYGLAPDLADGRAANQRRFRFLHDRVQQAAYALIPESERPQAHLAVGRLLLALEEEQRRPGWIFHVVRQLSHGVELMTDPAERLRLAELNLEAGRRAKASAAFPNALGYFSAGAAMLSLNDWYHHHRLAFALHLERAEAEYLTGRLEEAERSYATLLERAVSPLESADAHLLRMVHYQTAARYQDAISAGMAALRRLGFDLPENRADQEEALEPEMAAIRAWLAGRPVAAMVDLPSLDDPAIQKALKILTILWAPAYMSGETPLSDLVGARMVSLSLEHGNCEDSAYGYVVFAMTVGWRLGDYEQGHEFGQLGLALNERLADLRLRARVQHLFSALVNPWRRPFATCLPYAREAVRAGLESGDYMSAACGQFQESWWGMHLDPDLAGFLEKYEPAVEFLGQKMILQWARALQGRTEAPASLTGPGFDGAVFLETYGKQGIFGSWYVTMKLELLNTFGQVDEARAFARQWEPVAELFASSMWPAMFAFRHALSLCAWLPGAPDEKKAETDAKLDELAARLRLWADNSPENFGHLSHLAAGEIARVRGQPTAAFEHYEAALAAAQRQASPRYCALANELYGEFWLGRGQPQVAAVFLREAQYGYRQWGAQAKVAEMERRHAGLLAGRAAPEEARLGPGQTTIEPDGVLDLHTVFKVAQALAGAIDLKQLLGRLMRVAIEHTGAERGHFVLEHDGAPVLHVSGTTKRVTVASESGTPLADARRLPMTLVNLVRRTGETVVLEDAAGRGQFTDDPYVLREQPRSIICTAVVNHGRLIGVLYLENNLAPGVFTTGRAQVLQMIAAQAAIALEHANLSPVNPLKETQRNQILAMLEKTRWRVSGPRGAAVRLGLKPTTLEARMKKLGIVRPK